LFESPLRSLCGGRPLSVPFFESPFRSLGGGGPSSSGGPFRFAKNALFGCAWDTRSDREFTIAGTGCAISDTNKDTVLAVNLKVVRDDGRLIRGRCKGFRVVRKI
jgi:hypothetical protein